MSAASALALGPAAGAREEARNKAGQEPEWGPLGKTGQGWGSEQGERGQTQGRVGAGYSAPPPATMTHCVSRMVMWIE